jgi:hypothetical protein
MRPKKAGAEDPAPINANSLPGRNVVAHTAGKVELRSERIKIPGHSQFY